MKNAVVAVLRYQGKILAIRRGPQARRSGYWGFVAGRIEAGESEALAVVREVEEELGVAAIAERKVWQSLTDDQSFVLNWWTVSISPDAVVGPGAIETAKNRDPGEVSEVRWVTPEEFLELQPTFDGDRKFVTEILPWLEPPERG